MTRSMTGFGQGRAQRGDEEMVVELRSVNAKHCDVKPHLPRELTPLEGELVRAVKARIARGVVDVHVRREGAGAHPRSPRADRQLAAAYVAALRALKEELGLSGEPTVSDLAQLEGVLVLEELPPDLAVAGEALSAALEVALSANDEMRRREGAALEHDLAERFDRLEAAAGSIRSLGPPTLGQLRDRLASRVAELARTTVVDSQRLAQEVAFLADRSDIAEELTRFQSHLAQLRALLRQEAPAGRRLEFLLQEAHREVNTIGSKSQSAEIAGHVVDLKAELERIREQLQNVE
jgi:uncharacterized protein (TIGR00255 family)